MLPVTPLKPLAVLLPFIPLLGLSNALASPPNWTGKYSPCSHHADLLSQDHLDLAVRISTSNPMLAEQFESAMEFWRGVLDLDWHEVDSDDCAIQLVDGTPSVFDFCSCLSARSQLPDRPAFQGWIAFNPRLKLTRQEMFLDAVHEIGHLLGLTHNPNDSSVMFAFELDKAALLDAVDLAALASRHQLRPDLAFTKGGVRVTVPRADPRPPITTAIASGPRLNAARRHAPALRRHLPVATPAGCHWGRLQLELCGRR